jgi:hypothetical protein
VLTVLLLVISDRYQLCFCVAEGVHEIMQVSSSTPASRHLGLLAREAKKKGLRSTYHIESLDVCMKY